MKVNYSFIKDFDNHDAYKAAEKINIPVLIVHGDADMDVPYSQSRKLVKKFPDAKLVIIQGANHRYTEGNHAEQMLKALYEFVIKQSRN